MVTSSPGDCWLAPKGHIETTETAQDTALKEAEEEAGVRGKLLTNALGEYAYTKYGVRYRVQLFLLRVEEILEEWDESSIRQRRWVSPGEAAEIVSIPSLAKVLRFLPDRLGR
jgi:8-oxo-dGTP pyrophosphatase MutT (NUDIX family)